jgi:hypothetical protein
MAAPAAAVAVVAMRVFQGKGNTISLESGNCIVISREICTF